ncbi:CaiB/BaiF CoA transferase family protein [Prauserella rugosa]|uniref:Crotonobetainyl-CoA:carnitine CoA-transferase CaiB-like acyl-CoA transferase n=1 Tax=Prauserella rugosa TaxID=43354 RepID=A0A660C5H6_9PSEU|nr:CaiB/BaiF CoA-transferase family protein [Prauserella rugosa]KMS69327.1 acyl-CoA transferase [Streptomyces regensis]TWH18758.1 crotonobetainyl-CoA:carnitine CoA-transferase CaiB-like acyl-CoA transferase [Prauserella rugosa]
MTALPPLSGRTVLDFSTLLPGPLATLLLAEAGADVLRLERPPHGDEMRSYEPRLGADSANYALLNRGKRSVAVDLKAPEVRERVLELAAETDIVVEQFRPGVMDRLGLGYEDFRSVNPGVVYCSITGYGQTGPDAPRAGHDLNYLAETGLLGSVVDDRGDPHLPPTVLADIAGGTYPAVMNILLALFRRDATGEGCHLDVSMTANIGTLAYGYLATYEGSGSWPVAGRDLLTGGSPRYRIYRTSDGRHVAAAPLEERFWQRFCDLIGLPEHLRADNGRADEVIAAVAERIAARTAEHWRDVFDGEDACCCVVATFEEAAQAQRLGTREAYRVTGDGFDVGGLPVPVDDTLRHAPGARPAPPLWTGLDALTFDRGRGSAA